jgi:hypothetical protein
MALSSRVRAGDLSILYQISSYSFWAAVAAVLVRAGFEVIPEVVAEFPRAFRGTRIGSRSHEWIFEKIATGMMCRVEDRTVAM